MENQQIIDKSHEIADELQRIAAIKLSEARAYHDGYVQACEDFGRRLRQEIINEAN